MEIISSLFTAIGERFTGAAWYQYVTFPFWAFVILIALGGVYTASIQKNTLFCRGVTGALKLTLVYLCYFGLYRLVPKPMHFVAEFPFLSITGKTLTLVNPMSLLFDSFPDFIMNIVRLYWLLFCLNFFGHLDYGGRSKGAWSCSQILTCPVAVCFYEFLGIPFVSFFNWLEADIIWLYVGVAVLLLLPLGVLMLMKYIFIVFRKAGNPFYSKIMQFLAGQGFCSLFFVTFFSVLSVVIFLVVMSLFEVSTFALANFNPVAYVLIIAMCVGTLLVYSMYYTERKFG